MHPITVLTFNEVEHAQPLKERLEQAGIPAQIHDDRKLEKYYFVSRRWPASALVSIAANGNVPVNCSRNGTARSISLSTPSTARNADLRFNFPSSLEK